MPLFLDAPLHLVVLGAPAVGKTEMPDYEPTIEERHSILFKSATVGPVRLKIVDTPGKEPVAGQRASYVHSADGVILCYSVADPGSFTSAANIWDEVVVDADRVDNKPPLVLVGCQSHSDYRRLSPSSGRDLAARLGAAAHLECDAPDNDGVFEVFDALVHAIRLTQSAERKAAKSAAGRRGCCILL